MKSCTKIDSVIRRPVAVLPRTVIRLAESELINILSPIDNIFVEFVFAIPDGSTPVV